MLLATNQCKYLQNYITPKRLAILVLNKEFLINDDVNIQCYVDDDKESQWFHNVILAKKKNDEKIKDISMKDKVYWENFHEETTIKYDLKNNFEQAINLKREHEKFIKIMEQLTEIEIEKQIVVQRTYENELREISLTEHVIIYLFFSQRNYFIESILKKKFLTHQ